MEIDKCGEYVVRVGLRVGRLEWDADAGTYADIKVYRTDVPKSAAPIAAFAATAADLGLSDFSASSIESAARVREGNARPRLRPHIIPRLHSLAKPGSFVWLQVEDSSGYLPALPWELLFWQAGEYPVVRLDASSRLVTMPRGAIDAALCISCTADDLTEARTVMRWFSSMLAGSKHIVRLHIFADHTIRSLLTESAQGFSSDDLELRVYEPTPLRDLDSATMLDSNPWLEWMRNALKPYTLDYIHFVCDGELATESGNVRFGQAIHSSDRRWSGAMGPRGINAFLLSIGVWSAWFTSPPGNPSAAGLRYFCHLLSQVRAGPILFHELTLDPQGQNLASAYRYFTSSEYAGSSAISLFWNPIRAAVMREPKKVSGAEASPASSPLLVRAQRALESAVVDLERETDRVRGQGKEQALQIVRDALDAGAGGTL